MSISLNQLSDKVNSMGVETFAIWWNPESKVHNSYQLPRTDFDVLIGFATIWDVNNSRTGQLVPFMTLRLSEYRWDRPDGIAYQNNEGYWVTIDGNGLISTHENDAIYRLAAIGIKFHNLKIYYIFRYNIYSKIIRSIISSLDKIFTLLKLGFKGVN